MAALSKREALEKQTLYEIGYEYLRKNFHKFNERNKIKVAISILSIFEKDDSKTKPEVHTHFTVILNKDERIEESPSRINAETEFGVSTVN